jgi:hypothetical protein
MPNLRGWPWSPGPANSAFLPASCLTANSEPDSEMIEQSVATDQLYGRRLIIHSRDR